MLTGLGHIEEDPVRLAAVDGFRALHAVPAPGALALAPLHPLAALRPLTVDADVQAIVLGTGRVGARPDVVTARGVKMDLVVQHRQLAGNVREILAVDELVAVRAARVRAESSRGPLPRAWYPTRMSGKQTPEDAAEKLRTALEMYGLGESILRQKLHRTYPNASAAEIEAKVWEWLAKRPGAEHGDAPGKLREMPE